MKEKISGLKSHIGFWMRFVSNHVSRSFAQKIGWEGVTVAEWVILRELYENEGEVSPGLVVRHTGLTKGAVSKLIERLCAKKLATRRSAGHDKRFQEVGLSDRGRDLVPRLTRLADQNDREFFKCLSLKDQKELVRFLKKIVEHEKLIQVPID